MARAADRLGGRPPENPLGSAIPIKDAALPVADNDGIARVVEQRSLFAELLRREGAFGYVLGDAADADEPAGGVPNAHAGVEDPASDPVGQNDAVDLLESGTPSGQAVVVSAV